MRKFLKSVIKNTNLQVFFPIFEDSWLIWLANANVNRIVLDNNINQQLLYGPANITKTYQCPSDGLGLSCGSGLVELEVPELEVALCMAVGPACSIWGPVNVDRCCYLCKASAALIRSPFRSLSQFKLYCLVMLPSNC